MASKSMKPGAPKPPTPEEKEQRILRAIAMKREQYAVSAFAGLTKNPAIVQMANIREVVSGDGFTHTISVDLSPAVEAAVAAADALIGKLYAQPLDTPEIEK